MTLPDLGVPAPPRGPGVAPPFAAPPTDRNKRGLWIGLGVGAVVLLLCAVGGVAGIFVLYRAGTEQVKRDAVTVVTTYLNALRGNDFNTAQAQLCPRLAREYSPARLAADFRAWPFTNFRLDEPRVTNGIEVTAHLDTSGGTVDRTFGVVNQAQTLKICDIS
jgi:hypothetical protein